MTQATDPIQNYDEDAIVSEMDIGMGGDQGHEDGSGVVYETVASRVAARPGRKRLVVALFATAVLLVGGAAYLMLRHQPAPATAMSPIMAKIAAEANTIPVADQPKTPAAKAAPAPIATAGLASAVAAPAAAGSAPSATPSATPSAMPAAVPTASVASPAPGTTAAPAASPAKVAEVEATPVTREEYEKAVQSRDAATKEVQSLKEQLAAAEAKADAEPKVRVVHDYGHLSVRAVLKDGVVLNTEDGKTLVAPVGAKLTVTSRTTRLQ